MMGIGIDLATLRFAVRNLFRQKARTAMTLLSIVFGVVGLVLSGGFVEDIFIQLRDATIYSRLGHIQIYKSGYLANWTREPTNYLLDDPAAIQAAITGIPAVVDSMRRINFFGVVNNGKTDLPIIGEGIEQEKESAHFGKFFTVLAGRHLGPDGGYQILLGEGVAQSLNVKVGAYVNLLTNTPEGGLNSLEFEVVGIFRTFSKDFDARAVRIALADAQELLGVESAHAIVVALDQVASTDPIAARIAASPELGDIEVKTWFQLDDFYEKTVDLYQSELQVLQGIILIVVLLSVANSVNMTAYERIGEFGTLMALGNRRSAIARLIILENTLLGAFGAALGVLLGVLLAYGISSIGIPMPPPPNSSAGYTAYIRIVPSVLVVSFAIGFIATVLSSVLAARGASRVPVVEALRQNI